MKYNLILLSAPFFKCNVSHGAIQNTLFHMKPCVYCFSLLVLETDLQRNMSTKRMLDVLL